MRNPVLFFDSQCPLCNRFVDFLLWADRRGSLRFGALEGKTAARELKADPNRPDSVVLLTEEGEAYRSEAVIGALRSLGGFWGMAAMLRVIPLGVRDFGYDLVARHRRRLFGRLSESRRQCRVPGKNKLERLLP